jgi:phosphatidate phosphatase PAH1
MLGRRSSRYNDRVIEMLAVLASVVTDTRCSVPPTVTAEGFHHKRTKAVAKVASSNHRGIDLLANENDKIQVIGGKLAYGKLDKDAEDEDAEVFACVDSAWKSLGVVRTDHDGRFQIELTDTARLPVGMRDLYVAARGDGTGAYFVGYVAPSDGSVYVTDIDGTISWSENSIIKTVASRDHDIQHRPGAPEALSKLTLPIVYTTARGDVFIDVTRKWLERHGFPRGILRLSRGAFAKPGASAIAYKTATLKAFTVKIAAGIGNRKSDITAYTNIGLSAKQIFIHLPEFAKELKKDLDSGTAVGFDDYTKLPDLVP